MGKGTSEKRKKNGKGNTEAVHREGGSPGERALAALAGEMTALSAKELLRATVDVDAALVAARAVAERVRASKLHARFAALPAAELDIAHVDRLPTLIDAVAYAHAQLRDAAAPQTDAKVPYALVEVATQIKARMMRLVEYHFEDHPVLGPVVADIRTGSGYLDLATDLDRLSKIYDDEPDLVDKDYKNYLATDRDDARSFAKKIREALGAAISSDEKKWQDTLSRAWTLLVASYDEVRETGLWLLRHEIDRAERFPSLFAAGRPRVRTHKAKKSKAPAAPVA